MCEKVSTHLVSPHWRIICQDLLISLFLALHLTQLFLTEHSEAELLSMPQNYSKDAGIPAAAEVGRLPVLKYVRILPLEARLFFFLFSIQDVCSIKKPHKTTVSFYHLLRPWMKSTRQHGYTWTPSNGLHLPFQCWQVSKYTGIHSSGNFLGLKKIKIKKYIFHCILSLKTLYKCVFLKFRLV